VYVCVCMLYVMCVCVCGLGQMIDCRLQNVGVAVRYDRCKEWTEAAKILYDLKVAGS
jgi:hypothetical protein